MKLARSISRNSRAILVAAVILAVPAAIGFLKTGINYDILSYLPQKLNSVQGEVILDKEYGDASTAILILDGKKTWEVLDLKAKIAKVEGVEAAFWIDDLVDPSVPAMMLPEELRTGFYSATTTRVIIKLKESSTSLVTQKAIADIRALCDDRCYLSGASAIIKDTKDLADREMPIYILLAVAFSVVILALTMESPLIPFVFLAEIGLAILYNFGTNIVLGQISYLTQALAAVLQLGVTMDFSIFLLHRYEEERARFADRRDAMAEAIEKTFLTISGGALTEIAGFLALCAMDLTLGTDIGVVMAKGVLIGLVGTMTVLPAMLLVLDGPIHRFNHKPLLPTFKKTAAFVSKHYVALSLVCVLLFVPSFYGKTRAKQYYNLIDSLPADMASVKATNMLREAYDMTTTHFVIVSDSIPEADKGALVDEIGAVKGVTSVLAWEKLAGPLLPASVMPAELASMFKAKGHDLLIINSEYKASTDDENAQITAIDAIVKSHDPAGYLTGEGVLTKDLIRIAASDFRRVDIVSIGAVFLIILIIFKSLSVPVILVGGIELAIFVNMAVPFFTGEVIPFIATIVIGCIQLGVTIDYAILLVTRFREELDKGADRREAMRIALETSARSIVTSALTLFGATAGVGFFSKIAILKCLCGMIARGALISMAVILFLLPSVLVLCEGIISKTTLKWRRPVPADARKAV